MNDLRYNILYTRLSMLNLDELKRVKNNIDNIVLDTYNYHDGKYCILAVAKEAEKYVKDPTQEKVVDFLSQWFNPVNAIKGVPGDFFSTDRKSDLLQVVNDLLQSRGVEL